VIETARTRLAVALAAILAVVLKVPLRMRLLEMGSQFRLCAKMKAVVALMAVKVFEASVASALGAKADSLGVTKILHNTRVHLPNVLSHRLKCQRMLLPARIYGAAKKTGFHIHRVRH